MTPAPGASPRHARHRLSPRARRAGLAVIGSAGLVATGLGVTGVLGSFRAAQQVHALTASAHPAAATPSAPSKGADSSNPAIPATVPVALSIPAIGLNTTLQLLGLNADGALNPPTDTTQAGWYTGSVLPGRTGPSVLAGHVDTYQGPAVFYRLDELRPGDTVAVTLSDHTTVRFIVDAVDLYPKDAFPTSAVYGARPDPELRLITCGGSFDYTKRSYRDNVVVYARLAPST